MARRGSGRRVTACVGPSGLTLYGCERAVSSPGPIGATAAGGVPRATNIAPTTTPSGASRSPTTAGCSRRSASRASSPGWLATILRKREAFRAAFAGFDSDAVAASSRATSSGCCRTPASCAIAARSSRRSTTRGARASSAGARLARGVLLALRARPRRASGAALTREALHAMARRPQSIGAVKDLKRRGWTFVGPDHRLRLHAGDGARQRSPGRLRGAEGRRAPAAAFARPRP